MIRVALVGLVGVAIWAVIPVLAQIGDGDGTYLLLETDAAGGTTFATNTGSDVQTVGTVQGCRLDLSGDPLVGIWGTSDSGRAANNAGYNDGIGVKSGGKNGSPCGQVEDVDSERLVIGSQDRPWVGMALDLELKQNARVLVSLYTSADGTGSATEVFTLNTGSSITDEFFVPEDSPPYTAVVGWTSSTDVTPTVTTSCANPSDSGPDSGANDNCRLLVNPSSEFNSFSLEAVVGSVSLEGGEDYLGTGLAPPLLLDDAGVPLPYQGFASAFFYAEAFVDASDDAYSVDEDNTLDTSANATTGSVLDNDDPGLSGAILSATLVSGPTATANEGTSPTSDSGTLVLGSDGDFVYTPAADFNGSVTFVYEATDSAGSVADQATVTITVNSVPDAPRLSSTTITLPAVEDTTRTICPSDLGFDVDSPDAVLVVEASDGGSDTSVGTYEPREDGCVDYTPPENFSGDDDFTFRLCDDTQCSVYGSGTFAVLAQNDPPLAVDDPDGGGSYEVDQNRDIDPSSTLISIAEILGNDTDVDGDVLSLFGLDSDSPPEHGSATIEGDSIRYTPTLQTGDGGYFGPDSFGYEVTDGSATDIGTINIEIVEVFCTNETRESSTEIGTFGSFRLLDANTCKRYEVTATDTATGGVVEFVPEGSETASFSGEIRLPDGYSSSTSVGLASTIDLLVYDRDGDATTYGYATMPLCVAVEYDAVTGEVIGGTLPAGDTWCLVGVSARLIDTSEAGQPPDFEFVPVYIVYGEGDPLFRAR
jgi:hypothetical protein